LLYLSEGEIMDRSKTVLFSVTVQHIVEISENELVRRRVAYRIDYPDGNWDDDESIAHAVAEEYGYNGANADLVLGPWIKVTRLHNPIRP
jgi:hypothetical protein